MFMAVALACDGTAETAKDASDPKAKAKAGAKAGASKHAVGDGAARNEPEGNAAEKPEAKPEAKPEEKPEAEADAAQALAAVPEGEVDTAGALMLPAMHWAPARPVLDPDPILLVGGTVRDVKKTRAEDADVRGEPWIVSARIEVEEVYADRLPKARDGEKTAPLGTRKFVVAELADGLAVGDKVIVYGVDYEGAQALVEREGSNARLGIKVVDWSDPVVAAVRALGEGKADLSQPAQRAAWKPFGEGAMGCFAVLEHFGACDSKCSAKADPTDCLHACAEEKVGAKLTPCDRDM